MWGYVPSPCCDVLDERLIFCGFPIEGFCNITICKIYELYGEFWCMDFWQGMVVRVANNAQYVMLSMMLQWHLLAPHVHNGSHADTIVFWGSSLCVHAFISV